MSYILNSGGIDSKYCWKLKINYVGRFPSCLCLINRCPELYYVSTSYFSNVFQTSEQFNSCTQCHLFEHFNLFSRDFSVNVFCFEAVFLHLVLLSCCSVIFSFGEKFFVSLCYFWM